MKRKCVTVWVLALCLALPGLRAASEDTEKPLAAPGATPGVELAQTISTVTGVAISPLLGVGAVGAYRYYQTPPERRAGLPWYAQVHFWAPALVLVGLVFLKDALGPAVPLVLKKPFDALEVFENKLSALIVAGAFVPLVVSVFPSAVSGDSSALGFPAMAAVNWAGVGNALLVPFAIAAFAIVWLAAHAVNILILISPFATLDAALKSMRLVMLSTVTLTAFANPYVGAVWAVVLILFCALVAGWSFRLMVFGTVFSWDIVTFGRKRFVAGTEANPAFTARAIGEVPVRTYCRVRRDGDGVLGFEYRPWLVLPRRWQVLPPGSYAIGRGLVRPELLRLEGERATNLLDFPPRCRTHEEALCQACGLGEIRDVGLVAAWRWLKGLLGRAGDPMGAGGARRFVSAEG